ncbi:unnamed protein product [Kluyveromyces dobzhanskii CBS 2104]|uniref:ATP-dependent DNA helicase II subunit 1 n=1 Tax=Kluyveromyces dobzhanskii CBS 2104 TaxID=1427455 RepID=A0A0A8L280_9SACH|nr:unnamed protein product [Kluyveromyces dobzhanskii CBS 2104]
MSFEQPDFLRSQQTQTKDNAKEADQDKWRRFEAHDGIVFCIQLTPTMYLSNPDLNGKVQLIEILDSLSNLMSQLVIVMPSTAVGCYIFNCAHPSADENVYELIPLRDVNYKGMKRVADLLEDIEQAKITLEEEIPIAEPKNPIELSPALVKIRETFLRPAEGQKQLTNRKTFLFTDDDKPAEFMNVDSRSRLRKVVDDLYDYHINFVTFFIGSEEKPFDNSVYADILKWGSKINDNQSWLQSHGPSTNPISASYIKSKVNRTKEIKRIKFRCPFILDERADLIVSVNGYTIVSHELPGSKYKLVYDNGSVKREAYSHREYLDVKTGEVVDDEHLSKVYTFGEETIELTDKEYLKIQNSYSQHESFLKLIGFRSTDKCLHYRNNIDLPAFVVPNEEEYKGSIKTLASLYRTLIYKNKSAVVWGKLRPNSLPSMFMLTPSSEKDQNQGFYLYKIPFMEEVRKLPDLLEYPDMLQSDDYKVMSKVTETLINFFNLKNGYKPSDFHNPALQRHFKILREYLLQIEVDELKTESEDDETLQKVKQIYERIRSSANSDDIKQQRLVKYLKLWNSFYNRLSNLEVEKKPNKNKKPKVNL